MVGWTISLYDIWAVDVSILMLAIFPQEQIQQQLNMFLPVTFVSLKDSNITPIAMQC